jgi:hypothetical protein
MNLEEQAEARLSVRIFSVSAVMVGACLTVIGIVRIIIASKGTQTFADDLLALDALVFVAACLLAYVSIRTLGSRLSERIERMADYSFIAGLLLMFAVCLIIVYSII